jgi:SAM-dependent methyltransferase
MAPDAHKKNPGRGATGFSEVFAFACFSCILNRSEEGKLGSSISLSEGICSLQVLAQNEEILICPVCQGTLRLSSEYAKCVSCGHSFSCEGGIPQLFWANDWSRSKPDVTEAMKSFYEATPFPNYDDLDSGSALREKASRGIFARLLDEQIRHGSKVLEVGCGTGQLSNFLGMTWGRRVFGADACLNSLKLAEAFRRANEIKNVSFLQMNLFRPAFKAASFDVVISNGVLHHTSDPFLAFQTISKLVKMSGFVLIGLYNKYSRLTTDLRRLVFRLSADRFQFLDPRLRNRNANTVKKHTWFMDQYKNPHESKHTIGEVQDWFESSGFEFLNSIPSATGERFSDDEKLFEPRPKGNKFDHFMVQFGDLLAGGRDGGFFIMIGRRVR